MRSKRASPEFIKPFGQNHQALIPVGRYSERHVLCANAMTSICIIPAHFVIPEANDTARIQISRTREWLALTAIENSGRSITNVITR